MSGSVSFVGIWSGPEQKSFQAVIDAFNKQYPKVHVKYTSAGNNVPTVLSTAVQGGNPPDMADIAQPGLVAEFQQKGALKPIDFARSEIEQNFGAGAKLGEIDGKLYGLLFKASNKSTVWYNVSAFKNAGVTPATTWPQFLQAAKTLKASGVPAYSIGGSEGWTLTDLFENIYLRQAGPAKYDQLTAHQIKWTDPSVIAALKTMAQVIGDSSNIAGGTSGALQTDFATSVNNVLVPTGKTPKAAMVIEGDFVPGTATTGAKPSTDYNVFPFPSINGSPPVTEVVRRRDRDVQGHPGQRGVHQVPRHAAGRRGMGQARRLRHAQQEGAAEHLPRPDDAQDRPDAGHLDRLEVRHVR